MGQKSAGTIQRVRLFVMTVRPFKEFVTNPMSTPGPG